MRAREGQVGLQQLVQQAAHFSHAVGSGMMRQKTAITRLGNRNGFIRMGTKSI